MASRSEGIFEHQPSQALYWLELIDGEVNRAAGPMRHSRCLRVMRQGGLGTFLDEALAAPQRAEASARFVRGQLRAFLPLDYDTGAREFYQQQRRQDVPLDTIADHGSPRLPSWLQALRRHRSAPPGLYRVATVGPYEILFEGGRRWYCYHRACHALTGGWFNLCRMGLAGQDWAYTVVFGWCSREGAVRHARERIERGADQPVPEADGLVRRPDGRPYWWYVWWPNDNRPNVADPDAEGPWESEEAVRRRHPLGSLTLASDAIEAGDVRLGRQPDVEANSALFVHAITADDAMSLAQRWASPVWWVMSAFKDGSRLHNCGPYATEAEARTHDPSVDGAYVVAARRRHLAELQADQMARRQSLRFWYVDTGTTTRPDGSDADQRDKAEYETSGPYATREEAEQAHPEVRSTPPDDRSGEIYEARSKDDAITRAHAEKVPRTPIP